MPYFLDTTRLYRIWFSDNPDVFMNDENKLRFIQMRLQNPQAKLSLVYSSKCLSPVAIAELNAFCKNINITPFDVDNDLPKLLTDEHDRQIYELVRLEIQHTLNKTGGNLGSASDCARTLLPVIEMCGNYAEFDLEKLDFSEASSILKIWSPLVLVSTYKHRWIGGVGYPSINTDFLVFAYSSEKLNELHPHAIRDLRKIQSQIIQNYKNITPESIFDVGPRFKWDNNPHSKTAMMKGILRKYIERKPNSTLYDIRMFIHTMTFEFVKTQCEFLPAEFDEEFLTFLKWEMTNATVINTSGPGAYMVLFNDSLDKEFEVVDATTQGYFGLSRQETLVVPQSKWQAYSDKSQRYGAKCNNLHHYVMSKLSDENKYEAMLKEQNSLEDDIGKIGDMSWTAIGANNQKIRSHQITKAAVTMQYLFRRWKRTNKPSVQTIVEGLDNLILDHKEQSTKLGV